MKRGSAEYTLKRGMEGEAVPSREQESRMNRTGNDRRLTLAPAMHVRLRPAQHSFALQGPPLDTVWLGWMLDET